MFVSASPELKTAVKTALKKQPSTDTPRTESSLSSGEESEYSEASFQVPQVSVATPTTGNRRRLGRPTRNLR